MPPLPIIFDDETLDLIASAQRRERDLSEFQIPRLRKCQGPLSVQQTLAAELREDVEAFARQVEALDVLVEDQKGERNRKELRRNVDELRKTLTNLRKDARTALLASKRAIDTQSQSRREELLRSTVVNEKRDPNEKVTDDALMKASDDVTDALRRTIGLMQGELERSVLSHQMLEASTASLRSTSSTHDTLTNLMGTSKQLITALEKSDWLDRMLILAGVAFFFLVVLFILKQRILDRGLRIALWWTRFLPAFGGDAQLAKMEQGQVVSSVAAAAASSLMTAATVLSASTTQEFASPDGISQTRLEPSEGAFATDNISASLISPSSTDAAWTTSETYDVRDEL